MARQTALPQTLPPRMIGRDAAAAYVNLCPNTFDQLVKEGHMPRPRQYPGTRRLGWDVRLLDAAVDALPVEGGDDSSDSTWDDVNAP